MQQVVPGVTRNETFFYGDFVAGRGAVGLFLLRLFFGAGLMFHGFPKIQHPTSWMGPGAPVPGFLQFLAAFSEFFGGLALIGGLLVSLATLGIMATMLTASFFALAQAPVFASGKEASKELSLLYFFAALMLFCVGPGTISLDNFIFNRKRADVPETSSAWDAGNKPSN